jgi:outer membrane protein, heavy metal efflux system
MRSALVLLLVALATADARAGTLRLTEVLESVRSSHPLLAAAGTAVERAEAMVVAAKGPFDPRVTVDGTAMVTGYYQTTTVDTELSMLTPMYGLTPFVGWRRGRGNFAVYDEKLVTPEGGEFRAGAALPLLQGFQIDRPRADRSKAEIMRRVANAEVGQRLLDVMREASVAYWDWVAAGHRLDVRRTQLALALERARQIDQAVARGNRAPIEALDNERLVAAREALVVNAERDQRRASLELSLHLRGADGQPIVADASQRPDLLDGPPLALELDLDAAVARGIRQAPRLKDLDAKRDIVDVDVALASNQMLPRLGVEAFAARGLGSADPTLSGGTSLEFGIGATFAVPIGMHTARGALATAEQQFAADRVAVEIRGAHAELVAAKARSQLARRNADLAEQLAAAERTRFERGDSTVVLVNIREEAAADAAAQAVDARADVMRARARFTTLLGDEPT